jgi:hypothetical protein
MLRYLSFLSDWTTTESWFDCRQEENIFPLSKIPQTKSRTDPTSYTVLPDATLSGVETKIVSSLSEMSQSVQTIGGALDDPGFNASKGEKIFLFSEACGPTLGPTDRPIQWCQVSFLGVKRPRCEADHSRLVPRWRVSGAVPLRLHSLWRGRGRLALYRLQFLYASWTQIEQRTFFESGLPRLATIITTQWRHYVAATVSKVVISVCISACVERLFPAN